MPLVLGPVVIAFVYYLFRDDLDRWGSWQNGAAALSFILLNHYQITSLASNTNVQYPKDANDFFDSWAFSDDLMSMFKPQCAGFASFERTMVIRSVAPLVMAAVFVLVFAISHLMKRICLKPVAMDSDRTLNVYFSIILAFFAGIASMCIMIFKCHDNPNGKRTLSIDEGIVCGEETWSKMLGIAIAAIIIYLCGFGGVFTWAILVGPSRFADVRFQRRWKFLFIKYRPDVWWWTIAFCSKGVLMNLGFVFLDKGISQLNWIMGIAGLYLCLSILYMPWRHRGANIVEVYGHIGLMFVISLFTWYAHDAVENPEDIGRQISKVAIAINCSPMLVALLVFMWFVHVQTASRAQNYFLKEVGRLNYCLSTLAQAGEQRVIMFMQSLSDWDRFYMMQAAQVMRIEFPVMELEPQRPGSFNKERLTNAKSSVNSQATNESYYERHNEKLEEMPKNGAQKVEEQTPLKTREAPEVTPAPEEEVIFDALTESHLTPRSGRAAKPVAQSRTPLATPRMVTPNSFATPRDKDFPQTPPRSAR